MADRLRIAIIEDEPLIASGIAASVEELSHEVAAVFSNGVDALRQIVTLNVDLFGGYQSAAGGWDHGNAGDP